MMRFRGLRNVATAVGWLAFSYLVIQLGRFIAGVVDGKIMIVL